MNEFAALALVVLCVASDPIGACGGPAAEGQKAILVTGASTGIGRTITERLAADGVFRLRRARARTPTSRRSTPSRTCRRSAIDVTKPDQIAAAVVTVTQGGRGLWGLVNNAGVAIAGPFADLKDEDFDFVMNVNAYGRFRVTKAFLPAHRRVARDAS